MTMTMERSTRAAAKRETRFLAGAKLDYRSGDPATTTAQLDGYASMTGVAYDVTDWLGTYSETVERGAFAKTLAERDDVRLLLNHAGLPLARTASGTMRLDEDSLGLHVDADLDKRSTLTNDVAVSMDRKDLDQMSMAFQVTRQEWNEDYTQRWIKELKLFDTSVVTYPASTTTMAKLRGSGLDQLAELDDDELREVLARLTRRFADPIGEPPVVDEGLVMLRARAAMAV